MIRNIDIDKNIDKENIDIDIDINKDNLKNMDIDIDLAFTENINIDKDILKKKKIISIKFLSIGIWHIEHPYRQVEILIVRSVISILMEIQWYSYRHVKILIFRYL